MNTDQEMHQLKGRIAEVYARRERLKRALESGDLAPRAGLARLNEVDRELSGLDTRFKILWDAAQAPVKTAAHPAAQWALNTEFAPLHLDCITAIVLKTLDGKCKMGEAQKAAIAVVYDTVKHRADQGLAKEVHQWIEAARQGNNVAEQIHRWRVHAEAFIPKPEMKAFKQLLRQSLPLN